MQNSVVKNNILIDYPHNGDTTTTYVILRNTVWMRLEFQAYRVQGAGILEPVCFSRYVTVLDATIYSSLRKNKHY